MKILDLPLIFLAVSIGWSTCGFGEEAPPPNPPVVQPAPKSDWTLADERAFNGRKALDSYHPYYVIQADQVGLQDQDEVIQWHHYSDEPLIEYHPAREYLLNSSRVMDRWVRLAKQTPHTVKWEVEFAGGGRFASAQLDGVIIGNNTGGEGVPMRDAAQHKLTLQRKGKELSVQVDDLPAQTLAVEEDDRTPLRIAAQAAPLLLRSTKVYFGNGEKLSPPPAPKAEKVQPQWEKAFSENFSKEEALKLFTVYPDTSRLEWNKGSQALSMGPGKNPPSDDCYVLLHKPLPGDLRIKFRARSTLDGQPAFFGLLLNLAGRLRKEEAYFVEWNYWQVQIKKNNARVAGVEVGYDKRGANDWMDFTVQKAGGTITMFTDGKEVLAWTDPHPYKDSAHDL